MNKKELINRTCEALQAADIRKPVTLKSEKFIITDEGGDSAVFTIDRKDRRMLYTAADVGNILDMMVAVVEDAVSRGEQVVMRGFGSLEVRKVKGRRVKEPDQDIWHTIPDQYRPKFTAGCNLAAAARSYGLQQDDVGAEQYLPEPDDEDEDE